MNTADGGWRGSREGWLEAGYRALIDGGIQAVRIQPLARQLRLSRTSFYWFFQDREALLTALLDGWHDRTTVPLLAACDDYADTMAEAMLNVLACFLSGRFDAPLEHAVRSWALQDPAVGARLQAADAARLAALGRMLTRWGHPEDEADVRARTVYLTQIGYISMRAQEDMDTRLARIPAYVQIFTGSRPLPREMARFTAGLKPPG
ncbi:MULTISPECIES: TetR/AcrR family transcriptional regulator [unclassified Paracoccus (in: a-proteobacteria)]|uniref:TetR/AcrR family transcriptional regulator n=1 Tax=unclassified Paracoccus (in: a-proteobacteria) TaxID=2688777 RepID=UPI0012B206A8|nr:MULTISPECIES: TetR/AcrR family transcriptional regulator [unclassified Paracoccus (in: a-proteobacteria)]UXU76623.1 TetR/AcrR family transcriptional regulator [Paracoccus sp. SMMA_5]UXU82511.1 TetR/AcrR family transcriptional regulator [Paracoccus sp. SMMA_5_TC]